MSVPPQDPLGTEQLSESSKLTWTHKALALDHFRRFADLTIARNRDERVLFPHILFGLYVADKAGNKLSKADVCRLAEIDRATTGTKNTLRGSSTSNSSRSAQPPMIGASISWFQRRNLSRSSKHNCYRVPPNCSCS